MSNVMDWENFVNNVEDHDSTDSIKEPVENKGNLAPEIVMVNVHDIDSHDKNVFPMTDIKGLAGIIMKQGLDKPILVSRQRNGRLKAVTGNRRRAAVLYGLENGYDISPLMPVIIKEYKDEDEEQESLVFDNLATREMTQRQYGIVYTKIEYIAKKRWLDAKKEKKYKGPFRTYFAEEYLHIPETTLQRRLSLAKTEPSIAERIERGEISETAVSLIAAYSHPEQIEIIKKVEENLEKGGRITVKAIEAYLKRKKQIDTVVVQTTVEKLPEVVPVQAPVADQPEVAPVQAPESDQPEVVPVQAPVVDQPEAAPVQVSEADQSEVVPVQAPVADQPEVVPVQAPEAEQPEAVPVQALEAEQPEAAPVQAPVADQPKAAPIQATEEEPEPEYTKILVSGKISSIGVAVSPVVPTKAGFEYVKALLERRISGLPDIPESKQQIDALKITKKYVLGELEKLQ